VKRIIRICSLALIVAGSARAADVAEPLKSPKDGWISLFNGKDLTGWTTGKARNSWRAEDGTLANTSSKKARGVNIHTTGKYKDFDLYIEFRVLPKGNSGVYLRGRKEVQVAESYGVKTPGTGHCGGIYSKSAPKVNACKPAGEWQTFEITMAGNKITVRQNGTLIQDGVEVPGHTGGSMGGEPGTAGPIMLQGDHTNVWYRNIYLRPIKDDATK